MDTLFLIASFAGAALLLFRMWPRAAARRGCSHDGPRVSVIIPARNEEHNLPSLLESLRHISYSDVEIIVVDDQSTDGTAAVALDYHVKLIHGKTRPAGWNGKQWACYQGARAATGTYLLFTDADTKHFPHGISTAVEFMRTRKLEMASTLPFHDCRSSWEKILGPFHILLLAVTAPYSKPVKGRVFAIGQFLMFTRSGYDKLGGHESVKNKYVEDVPMANLALDKGLTYAVHHGAPLFSVRMYEKFGDFIKGWRRNFRAGMADSRRWASAEVTLMICGMTGAIQFTNPFAWIPIGVVFAFITWRQRLLGSFSAWGAVLLPFALFVFCWVSLLGALDEALGRQLAWKDRQYAPQG